MLATFIEFLPHTIERNVCEHQFANARELRRLYFRYKQSACARDVILACCLTPARIRPIVAGTAVAASIIGRWAACPIVRGRLAAINVVEPRPYSRNAPVSTKPHFGHVTFSFERVGLVGLEPRASHIVLRKILWPQPQQTLSALEQIPAGHVLLAAQPRVRYACGVHRSYTRYGPDARRRVSGLIFKHAMQQLLLLASLMQRLLGRGQAAPDQRSDRCICRRTYLLTPAPSLDGCEHLAIKS